MRSFRAFLPLLFILSLLSAQQAGAAHAIRHALEQSQRQDPHPSHSGACEKCENYAQLGGALSTGSYEPALLAAANEAIASANATFDTLATPAATARGPPAFLPQAA